ncbi:hypothetical protein L1987_37300 [Smallanthus sonchifolius]|uniref:Uncharacterized protein n=1 Tax=Smallanthus sonchifolius TaxID=185202 RepID=A0ACB9HIJ3_9ASTR|nr:hypothetical protein L1987_37300 [Smallanthus sonchifolius]
MFNGAPVDSWKCVNYSSLPSAKNPYLTDGCAEVDTWLCEGWLIKGNPYIIDGCIESTGRDYGDQTEECRRCEENGGHCASNFRYGVDDLVFSAKRLPKQINDSNYKCELWKINFESVIVKPHVHPTDDLKGVMKLALFEDAGDKDGVEAYFLAKDDGIVARIALAEMIFNEVDPTLKGTSGIATLTKV